MEDTLRYYFSSMFQGFAAIITLGAMYILYYFEKVEVQKKDIVEKLQPHVKTASIEFKDFILMNGDMEFIKQKYLPPKKDRPEYNSVRFLVNKYDSISETEKKIKEYLPKLLKKTIMILVISLGSLFAIGYNTILNYLLFVIGIFTFIISLNILLIIKKVILEITKSTS